MSSQNILVAIRRDPEAARILEKVARLYTQGCKVHVVRVIHDDRDNVRGLEPDERWKHKTLMLQAEREALDALIDPYRARMPSLASLVVWNKRFHRGVLDVAAELGADLIVKQAETKSRLAEVVRTPDDWHLLREAACPVLLVKSGLWVERPCVLAAVDALDDDHVGLSHAVLSTATELARQIGGSVELASAFPTLQPWPGEVGLAYDYSRLRNSMMDDIAARQKSLQAKAGCAVNCHAVEGEPSLVLERLAEELAAEVVVMGTAARRGVSALVIGNTSEAMLHDCHRDVLVLRELG